tara:strand:+ start:208 stop:1494 length:1287 start_codon:yes stop_codon:yes gene_type:complete
VNLTSSIRDYYINNFPADAVDLLEREENPGEIFTSISNKSIARLFEYVDPASLKILFLALSPERQTRVLQLVSIRCALLILRDLSADERKATVKSLPASVQKEFNQLLEFPSHTAGRFMDRVQVTAHGDQTVRQTLESIRQSSAHRIRSLYLVTRDGVLTGRVDLQDMALASADAPMEELNQPVKDVAYLNSTEDELVDLFDRSRLDSIPVVDHDFKLIGIIRYTNLFQAAEDAASADIQRMVGVSADERALSPPLFAVKRRIIWLHINLLTAFLAAAVVGLFESTIAQFTALAILLPVVAGQSGNAGSQALAVTMRGLALREVSTLHWRAIMSKEVRIGLINGSILAITCGLGVWLWSQSWGLALVIAIAMVTAMLIAGISGALVPMVLSRMGQDPATAASIILTTVTDVAGFLAFLGTATLLAGLL